MRKIINFDKSFEQTIIEKRLSLNDTYVVILQGKRMQTLETLYNELEATLQLPSYFGRNWNALDECLTDFSWISDKKIIIGINDFEKILYDFEFDIIQANSEVEIFLDCLQCAVNELKDNMKVYIQEKGVVYEILPE